MSPKEMRQLSYKFIEELEKRLIADGYTTGCVEILEQRPHSHILKVVDEVYELLNTGDYANWQYLGKLRVSNG